MQPARHRHLVSPGAALGLALVALLCAACGGQTAKGPPARVVLITLDTLRYDSLFGESGVMPRLAARAESGLVFDRFYSATSSTQPTHASIFTGLHPWQHGVTRNGLVLPASFDTLAERLADTGWSTGAVVASFPLDRRFLFQQGFDHYHDEMTEEHLRHKDDWNDFEIADGTFYSLGEHVTSQALEQIDLATGEHQFFWFHYFDPHAPYGDAAGGERLESNDLRLAIAEGPEAIEQALATARALYDQDIARMDEQIERVLARLDQDSDRYETHVIVTADHGESFGEDNSYGHRRRVTRYQVHVPCVVMGPRVPPGRRDEPAGSVDLYHTLLSLAGVSGADDGSGRDLLAPLGGRPAFAAGMRATVTAPVYDPRTNGRSVLIDTEQYFLAREDGMFVGNPERLQTGGDRGDPELLAEIAGIFAEFQAELRASESEELMDDETLEALNALGY
jgi:arylsulfatase A-like enzyme